MHLWIGAIAIYKLSTTLSVQSHNSYNAGHCPFLGIKKQSLESNQELSQPLFNCRSLELTSRYLVLMFLASRWTTSSASTLALAGLLASSSFLSGFSMFSFSFKLLDENRREGDDCLTGSLFRSTFEPLEAEMKSKWGHLLLDSQWQLTVIVIYLPWQ